MRTVTVDEEESTIIIYDNWRQVGQTTVFCSHDASSLLPHTTSEVSLPRQTVCSAASDITVVYTSTAAVASGIHVHLNSASISPVYLSFIISYLKKEKRIFKVTQVHCSFIGRYFKGKECL